MHKCWHSSNKNISIHFATASVSDCIGYSVYPSTKNANEYVYANIHQKIDRYTYHEKRLVRILD